MWNLRNTTDEHRGREAKYDNMVLIIYLIDVPFHVDCFVNIEPPLHPGSNYHLVVVMIF